MASKLYVYRYKCRRCDELFDGAHTSNETLITSTLAALTNREVSVGAGIPVSRFSFHDCDGFVKGIGSGIGFGDLVGVDIRKDPDG